MTLDLIRVRPIPVRKDAVQLNFENIKQVAEWLGGEVRTAERYWGDPEAEFLWFESGLYAWQGEWILKDVKTGEVEKLTDEEYQARYEQYGTRTFVPPKTGENFSSTKEKI